MIIINTGALRPSLTTFSACFIFSTYLNRRISWVGDLLSRGWDYIIKVFLKMIIPSFGGLEVG